MELLKKYIQEIGADLVVDEVNVKEVQMRLPARRHFWVARLINAKIELGKLQKKEKQLKANLTKKLKEESPVTFTTQHIDNLLTNNTDYASLQSQIEEMKYVVEYLEKVEKIFSTMGYEVKNIVELIKLETL